MPVQHTHPSRPWRGWVYHAVHGRIAQEGVNNVSVGWLAGSYYELFLSVLIN
jgi:hypothetical protein